MLFHVHCCLSISLRPDLIEHLVTTLIEGGKKSLQIATVKRLIVFTTVTAFKRKVPLVERMIVNLPPWFPSIIARNKDKTIVEEPSSY